MTMLCNKSKQEERGNKKKKSQFYIASTISTTVLFSQQFHSLNGCSVVLVSLHTYEQSLNE
ncbi:hypothetical protein T4D_7298 [Trichinella pseudospiralis]|uniref:Uncharacterized protein n=1 Tax=Trichinella pseudospiralis TaxID=6337 RepID=A0A0V1FT90_TRIPS|nr:hypothetical protein T4D_7298 [Trichinella pseudospiralis]